MPMNMHTRSARLRTPAAFLLALTLIAPRALLAQEHQHEQPEHDHEHGEEDHHHGGLHFSHPLVAESVTPDTKVRLDTHFTDGGTGSTLELVFEAEYAFAPAFSIEVGATPYVHNHLEAAAQAGSVSAALAPPLRAHLATPPAGQAEDAFSDLDVAFKFANFAFADRGVLLGYGATVGIPMRTGEEPVHAVTTVEPFLDMGYQRGIWELSGFTRFAIPTGAEEGEPGHADLVTNLAVLAHLSAQLQTLLEMDSSSPLGGGDDPSLVHLTPGLKVRPLPHEEHLIVGAGLRIPISETKVFDRQAIMSVFWHF